MATTTITVRTDDFIKQQAQELFSNLGLDMSAAVNVFLRAAIKAKAIPFAIADGPDAEYQTYIRETIAKRMANADDPNRKLIPAEEVWAKLEKKWGGK